MDIKNRTKIFNDAEMTEMHSTLYPELIILIDSFILGDANRFTTEEFWNIVPLFNTSYIITPHSNNSAWSLYIRHHKGKKIYIVPKGIVIHVYIHRGCLNNIMLRYTIIANYSLWQMSNAHITIIPTPILNITTAIGHGLKEGSEFYYSFEFINT